MNQDLTVAAGLGAVTGLRSMTGLAVLSRTYADRRVPWRASRLREWLARDAVANTVIALALGELVADKLPGVPDRIAPGPLFGRGLIGAVLGALVAGADQRAAGAAAGAATAIVAAYLGWFARREAGRATFLPDPVVALVEDGLAVTAARELTADL
jgi:uncharacterized membrane protein